MFSLNTSIHDSVHVHVVDKAADDVHSSSDLVTGDTPDNQDEAAPGIFTDDGA